MTFKTSVVIVLILIGNGSQAKNKRFDAVDCFVKKQQFGSVLECGEDLFSVKMGSSVEKSLYQICRANFKCKISFEVNAREEVTKILSAFSKGKKQAQTFNTSFECGTAKGFVEETICTNQELAILDNHLGAEMKKALERSLETKKIRDEQKTWIKDIRDKCSDPECLKEAYTKRLEKIKNENQ